jgi:ribonuclease P protein component
VKKNSFPRVARLTNTSDFLGKFEGRDYTSNFVVLSRENQVGIARVGAAISKKRVPLAVVRNLIKRSVRENFRTLFPSPRGVDLVIRPTKGIEKKDIPGIAAEISTLLNKIKK